MSALMWLNKVKAKRTTMVTSVTSTMTINLQWPLDVTGNHTASVPHVITPCLPLGSTLILSDDPASQLQIKLTKWGKNFLDPYPTANIHLFSLPICYHR